MTSVPDVKKIAFTFITVVVVPLLFFVLLELGLTVAGVGTSFDYFHEIDIDGQPHYQENPDFADQFYPPSLNIGPLENTFVKERDPELVRVFILGGSAALGFPHKNHGFDRLLETQLRAALRHHQDGAPLSLADGIRDGLADMRLNLFLAALFVAQGVGTLLLVERAEFALFETDGTMREVCPGVEAIALVADICDGPRMEAVFDHYRPAVVFLKLF